MKAKPFLRDLLSPFLRGCGKRKRLSLDLTLVEAKFLLSLSISLYDHYSAIIIIRPEKVLCCALELCPFLAYANVSGRECWRSPHRHKVINICVVVLVLKTKKWIYGGNARLN